MNWKRLFHRKQDERELQEEIDLHLSIEAGQRRDRGESPADARAGAKRDFGNVDMVKEVTRDVWGWTTLEAVWRDIRYAFRILGRSRVFTLTAILALGLGIGGTTAMFTVVNSVLLRSLSFPDPDRLVTVWELRPDGGRNNSIQTQNFLDWRARSNSFEAIAAIHQIPMNLTGLGEPVQVTGLRVSAEFFRVLGVQPLLGRTMVAAEDVPGEAGVVVLGYGLYQRRYGADPGVLGQKISVNGVPAEVVGVMPPGFALPTVAADLYIPIKLDPRTAPNEGRNYQSVARLKSEIDVSRAGTEMQAIAAQTARERPKQNTGWSATVVPLMEQTVGQVRSALLVLFAAVCFVLLIACTNVANLLLMRGAARRREMTLRMALGAGRWRLSLQLMVESLTLALFGGALGVALAHWGLQALIASLPAGFPLPRMQEIHIDLRALAFASLVSIGVGLIFGLLPALQVRQENLNEPLSGSGRSVIRGQRRLRSVLVTVEVATAVVLAIGAGLMLRSFERLNQVDPGFRSGQVLTLRMLLVPAKYAQPPRRAAFLEEVLDRVRALPQVTAAGSIHFLPMTNNSGTGYYRADRPVPRPGEETGGEVSIITPGYFSAMGIPLTAGRDFESRDRAGSPDVAILNESAAKMLFPGEDPVGKHITVSWGADPQVEVVGIVADVRHGGLQYQPDPCLFMPNAQQPNLRASLVVRTTTDPMSLVRAITAQIHAVDPEQGFSDIETMDTIVDESIASPRLQAVLLGSFGIVALILLSVGVYGIISYSVVQRTREIGVRLALGANRGQVLRSILSEGLTLTAAGSLVGVMGAFAGTRYLKTLLYEVAPTDVGVFTTVIAAVFAVATLACLIPAMRAARVDPTAVLRDE